jgi:hypothetical protein
MVRFVAFHLVLFVLFTVLCAQSAVQSKEARSDLERLLWGSWKGPACSGDWAYQADGTFAAKHYSPGDNQLTGTWEVRWNALPPTLVRTCETSDDPELVGKTWELRLIQLDGEALAYQYPDHYPRGHVIRYTRVNKAPVHKP